MPRENEDRSAAMKTLFVTGASSDIGLSIIRRVSGEYDLIWAHYLHWSDRLDLIQAELGEKIHWLQADLTQPEALGAMINSIRDSGMEPDHIIHLPMPKVFTQRFLKTPWKDFEAGWEMALRSAVILLQAFLPHMQKQKSGKIILMLTSYTIGMPPKYQSAYVTVKYALLGLMKSLAVEYADKGITFNAVSPEMMDTKYIAELPHLLVEQVAASRPEGRILTVDEVAPTFVYLLSASADHITGENILIS